MIILKVSMACWMVAKEDATRRKVAAATKHRVPTVTGGGPFEIAVAQDCLPAYLDLCADIGFTRIECGEGFTDMPLGAREVMGMAERRGLEVQFELGKKHGGAFNSDTTGQLIAQGRRWLDAGARELVVEARESAKGVGLFDEAGDFNGALADRFANEFGLDMVTFEAPNKPSQFALLDHFGPRGPALQCPAGRTAARGDLPARPALRRFLQGEPPAAPGHGGGSPGIVELAQPALL